MKLVEYNTIYRCTNMALVVVVVHDKTSKKCSKRNNRANKQATDSERRKRRKISRKNTNLVESTNFIPPEPDQRTRIENGKFCLNKVIAEMNEFIVSNFCEHWHSV